MQGHQTRPDPFAQKARPQDEGEDDDVEQAWEAYLGNLACTCMAISREEFELRHKLGIPL